MNARLLRCGVFLTFAAALLLTASGCGSQAGRVRTWEEEVVIPTYALGPDDPNPQFYELTGSIIYPYTVQDGFSSVRVERTYRAVFLENDYLRVMCLPEIGGRIQSVYDKVRGEEMFHYNQVIKPGHIALRGAWISGGIEWNRGPQGHTVTSFSPVDVVSVQNPDGSASLVIGYTEKNFRTAWSVRLTLHPDRAYLDEQIEIFNPTDGFHPYYFWNNTAFPQLDGTRFIYPMTLGSDHDGKVFFSWPIDEGRDLTWLKNYPGPTSVFGYQVPFDFFGAYDVDRDFGIVQVADHRVLPGKKAWTWGQSDAGMVAQSVLTDEDGPYIEVQSGPLPTQADFEMLLPGQSISWQEYWYPVGGLVDGFEYATRHVAVQRRDAGAAGNWSSVGGAELGPGIGVELRFLPTGTHADARIEVRQGDRELAARTADLEPGTAEIFELDVAAGESVSVEVTSAEGDSLLRYDSPLQVPDRTPPEPEPATLEMTAEHHYVTGFELDKMMNRVGARREYEAALEADASHMQALVALAVLDAEAGRYEGAQELLDRALSVDPESGLALYLRGVANLRLGDLDAALADGGAAAERPGSAALGYGLTGRALMLQGDHEGAVATFEAGLGAGDEDRARLSELLMLAVYAAGDGERAEELATTAVDGGIVRLVPWAVAALAEGGSIAGDEDLAARARRFADSVSWVGEPEFAHLELAFELASVGLVKEAAALTHATLVEGHQSPRPLPLYTLAYLQHGSGDMEESRSRLEQARRTMADYVFASRPEMIAVLRHALSEDPNDARAHEYLGNLYAGLGRLGEAEAEWRQAAELDGGLSVAPRNLGLLAWKRDADLSAAGAWYRKAIDARPDDQTLVRDLARVLIEQGENEEAIGLLEATSAGGAARADVIVLLARSYTDEGRYDEAIALLEATTFTNREGVRDTWEIFSRAHIERGIERLELAAEGRQERAGEDRSAFESALADFEAALTYPRNLNAGRPHEPLEARALYWKGRALEAMGEAEAAHEAWQACAAGVRRGADQQEHIRRCEEKLR